VGSICLIIAMIVFTTLHFAGISYVYEFYVENLTKIFLLVLAIIFVLYGRKYWNDKVFRFLTWGNGSMLLFSLLSYLFTFLGPTVEGIPEELTNALIYYQLGIFFELVFFLAGLSYKNRRQIIEQTRERERLKAENQMKEIEKELAVLKAQQEERNRISVDMHDELGSGMTAIRLMSELAKSKMKESSPVEIDRISDSANDVLNKMNAIIWSMNSGNDTLDNLISYIRLYALEYFDNTPINCKVVTPEHIEQKELTGDKRRNIFLALKETLNNALKHSGATKLDIDIEANSHIIIRIQDNGKGIDLQKLRQFGNGLKNIQNRMNSIGGNFTIENKNGTLTTLTLPL
jgi:signal transduction histidine kinase